MINGSISAIFLLAIVNNNGGIMAYTRVNALLLQNDPNLTAAGAHGMATGMLCANANTLATFWLTELLQNATPLNEEETDLLVRLFEETRRLLTNDTLVFDLFLPDDDALLSDQAFALKSWCEGFLYGVGSAQISPEFSADAREILKDIAEFTKLDTLTQNEDDDDEQALTEITEYLRIAVVMLRIELGYEKAITIH